MVSVSHHINCPLQATRARLTSAAGCHKPPTIVEPARADGEMPAESDGEPAPIIELEFADGDFGVWNGADIELVTVSVGALKGAEVSRGLVARPLGFQKAPRGLPHLCARR